MATTNVQITQTRSTPAQRIIALGVVFVFFCYCDHVPDLKPWGRWLGA